MDELNEMKFPTLEEYTEFAKAQSQAKPYIKKFKDAWQFVQRRFAALNENMVFYEGNPYELSYYTENRPWVVKMNTPYASLAIDTRTASLKATDYRGRIFPMTPEDKDTVEALENILHDEWERMEVDRSIDDAITNSAVVRESYAHIFYNDEKKMEIKQLDTNSVLIDPRAREFNKAQYICVVGREMIEVVREKWPKFEQFFPENTAMSPDERSEIYSHNEYDFLQTGILTVMTIFERRKDQIWKVVLVEDFLVEEKHLSALKRFPVAQMRWARITQSAYGKSLMDDIITLQKGINMIDSAIVNIALAYASPAVAVRNGSGVNAKVVAKTMGAPGTVYTVNGDPKTAIVPIVPPQIDDKIVTIKKEMENTIDRIAGITNPYLGSIGTAGNTAQGAKLAVERAKIIEAEVLRNISEFVETITMIIMDYVVHMNAGEVVQTRKFSSTESMPEFKTRYVPENAKDAQYSFYVNLDKKTPYSKEREREQLLQIYQMEHQYDAPVKLISILDLIGTYDLENVDELKQRFKMLAAQSDEKKAQVITELVALTSQYQIPPEMVQGAVIEIISGAQQTPVYDQVMMMLEQVGQQMEQEKQASLDDLSAQGMDPQMVQQASQMLEQQQGGPSMQDLGM